MSDFIEKVKSEIEDDLLEVVVYKITNYPADFTLQGLYDKWRDKDIEIPPFQRGFVWSISQSSKLIESFLLGLPVPSIFLYKEHDTQRLLVIDGQQRLRSVFGFMENNFPGTKEAFALVNVHQKWESKIFNQLEEPDKRRLRDSVLRAVIVEQLDPKDDTSITHIFQRLNSGATVLNNQEIRNCLFQGKFNDTLKELNNNKIWRQIIGLPKSDKRMRDIELILRFLSLYFDREFYSKPMKDFLSKFMAKHKNNDEMIANCKNIFLKTVEAIHSRLGANLFRLRAGLNAAVLDAVMVAFATKSDKSPSDIKDRYKTLLQKEEFILAVSSGTTGERFVSSRISLAINTLFEE